MANRTYCAVVKYPVEATDKEKLAALREGLGTVLVEMIELGASREAVYSAIEEAQWAAEEEWRVFPK